MPHAAARGPRPRRIDAVATASPRQPDAATMDEQQRFLFDVEGCA